MFELAVHLWRRGLELNCKHGMLTTTFVGHTILVLPLNSNETIGVPQLSFADSWLDIDRLAVGIWWRPIVRSEQKHVSMMMHLISEFCSAGIPVLEFWVGAELTAIISCQRPSNSSFFGCEADALCHLKSMPSSLEVFARHIVNNDSDIDESEQM